MDIAKCLTVNEIKEQVFSSDRDYLDGMETLTSLFAATSNIRSLLWSTASLLLRPDAIAGGGAAAVFPALRELGLIPVAALPVSLSLGQTRALWKYQANVSSRERLRLLDLIMTSGKSLYVLFHDLNRMAESPATVHMTYLKGTAIVENRKKWHLRTLAGPKVANVVSFVHVSDDPADMVREMALLFPPGRRRDLLRQAHLALDCTTAVLRILKDLEAELPRNLFHITDRNAVAPPMADVRRQFAGQPETVPRHLSTEATLLAEPEQRRRWRHIVEHGRVCAVFIDGNSYDGHQATIPDDTAFSLPLDASLIFPELGPR